MNVSSFVELSETRESARDRTMGDSKQVVAELLETELVRKGGGGSWAHDVEEGRIRKTIRIESESILGEEARYIAETQYGPKELRTRVT